MKSQSHGAGVRACIREFGPELIGENPLEIDKIGHIMNEYLPGNCDAKSPIDIACWDILGKVRQRAIVTAQTQEGVAEDCCQGNSKAHSR